MTLLYNCADDNGKLIKGKINTNKALFTLSADVDTETTDTVDMAVNTLKPLTPPKLKYKINQSQNKLSTNT